MGAAKLADTGQEYQYTLPIIKTPSGHEIFAGDTPGNRRLQIKHSSGSQILFTEDGSIVIIAKKDIQIRSGGDVATSEVVAINVDTDMVVNVNGKFHLHAKEIQLESDSNFAIQTSSDFTVKGNNVVNKATEQLSLESTKSIYVDSKELRERVVARQSEVGSAEGIAGTGLEPSGGYNEINVMGNTVIKNNDPKGGVTIQSAGYLNFICGAERIDVTGDPVLAATTIAANATGGLANPYINYVNNRATYTHIVRPSPGPTPGPALLPPGSMYIETPGGYQHNCGLSWTANVVGITNFITTGISNHTTTGYAEIVAGGPLQLRGNPILLN